MRIVVALGGNALLERGETPDADIQESHVARAVEALAPLEVQHDLIITHGNGPQVGVLSLESAADRSLTHPYPFDSLVAETQGLIGNWLVQSLERAMPRCRARCLLTRTVVDESDPAFENPTKFVGPIYLEDAAKELAAQRGWAFRPDGPSWRRVVPSPEPIDVVEIDEIDLLTSHGTVVVCCGGGGVPVVREASGLRGVEAVLDKDLTAALLAERLGAGALMLLTDVDAVELDYGSEKAHPIRVISVRDLRALNFPAGSMGPKVEAACRFVERTGGRAAIGRLADAVEVFEGKAGTLVVTSEVES